MKTNLYVIFDKVADETVVIGSAKTDGLFVRQNQPYLQKINPNYLDDYEIRCVGEYIDSDCKLVPADEVRVVPFDSYGHPEEKGDNIKFVKHN